MTNNQYLEETEDLNSDANLEFWNDINEKEYFDFKEGVPINCEFSNWQTDRNAPPDKYGRTHVLKATLLVDKKEYYFSTRSTRLLNALKPYFKDRNGETDIIKVKVKQIGKDNAVQYDVEALD